MPETRQIPQTEATSEKPEVKTPVTAPEKPGYLKTFINKAREIGKNLGGKKELEVIAEGPANDNKEFITKSLPEEQKNNKPEETQETEISDPRIRFTKAINELQERARSKEHEGEFAHKGYQGDGNQIEGHQIDLVQQKDKTVAHFKTTSSMTSQISNGIIPNISPDRISDGTYSYQNVDGKTKSHADSDCWIIQVDDNTKMYISKGEASRQKYKYDYDKPIKDEDGNIINYQIIDSDTTNQDPMLSFIGAVKIETQGISDADKIADSIDSAFKLININDALTTPDQQSEAQYKEARYRWQHKLEDQNAWENHKSEFKAKHGVDPLGNLERREVFPDYSTIVDQDASERYQKNGEIHLLHGIPYAGDNLLSILKEGLLSNHEKLRRGTYTSGTSVGMDLMHGSADSVFITGVTGSLDNYDRSNYGVQLLINPEVLDRTDWYSYTEDKYGTTNPSDFESRPAPEQFFDDLQKNYTSMNEMMFRRGIPPEMISGIIAGDKIEKNEIIKNLQTAGFQEINGTPIDQFVTAPKRSILREYIKLFKEL